MKTTVIINTFNKPEYTRLVLRSIATQSVQPDEVIITDDGSSDSQLPVLVEQAAVSPFELIFVGQEDAGFRLSRSRNNGIMAASGDYLLFLDQDRLLSPDYIKTHITNAQPDRFLVSQQILLGAEETTELLREQQPERAFPRYIASTKYRKNRKQYYQDLFYFMSAKLGYRSHRPKLKGGMFSLFKKDLEQVNGFDENFVGWGSEDDDLGRRLYAAGINGCNPFKHDFAVHLYHKPYHQNGARVNDDYYRERKRAAHAGEYRCANGLAGRDLNGLDYRALK